jgi:hypothetical protein
VVRKYTSRLAQEIEQHADALQQGYVLAIDPSSGSSGSLPGYAVFRAGRLVDAGLIGLPRGTRAIANRLYLLRNALATEFEKPDVLVIELISPVMPSKNGTFLHKSAASLIKSVGAILSTWDVPTLEVSPTTWHSMTPPTYTKTDVNDAIMIGWAALITLARVRGEPEPPPPEFPAAQVP